MGPLRWHRTRAFAANAALALLASCALGPQPEIPVSGGMVDDTGGGPNSGGGGGSASGSSVPPRGTEAADAGTPAVPIPTAGEASASDAGVSQDGGGEASSTPAPPVSSGDAGQEAATLDGGRDPLMGDAGDADGRARDGGRRGGGRRGDATTDVDALDAADD
jgi:hypothetical protein